MNHDQDHALEQLAAHIKEMVGDRTQEVLGELQDQLGDSAKRSTLESRLSNLVNAKRAGAKHFFDQDPDRGEILLRVLDADDAQRIAIRDLIDAVFADSRPVQLVVDITDWTFGSSAAHVWTSLERHILGPGPRPAVLVLTAAQHGDLPRRFDDVVTAKVTDAASAEEVVRRHAGEEALVVSQRRFEPWTRWVAVEQAAHTPLRTEPTRFPAAPVQAASPPAYLDELSVEPAETTPDRPRDALTLRRTLRALATGSNSDSTHVPADPRGRLTLATALGIRAAATTRECLEFERVGLGDVLGEPPQTGTQGDLDALLERARRRPVDDAALLVDDELHLVNHSAEVSERRFVKVRTHAVECAKPALARLRAVAQRYSEADWLDDPDLSSAVERLCREGANRRELLHARATLHYAGLLEMRPLPRPTGLGWKTQLVRLLKRPPVPAVLRASLASSTSESQQGQHFLSFDREDALEIALEIPSMGGLVLSRDQEAPSRVARAPLDPMPEGHWHQPALVLDADPTTSADVDRWCDLIEASPGLLPAGASRRPADQLPMGPGLRVVPNTLKGLAEQRSTHPAPVPGSVWDEADRLLALSSWTLLDALDALDAAAPCALPNGGWLVAIPGTGFFAELDVFEPDSVDSSAPPLLDAVLQVLGWGTKTTNRWELTGLVPVLQANTYNTRVGGQLPLGLTYRGEGLYVRVRYGSSPLLLGDASRRSHAATAAAHSIAARADDERQRDDDDDDD